MILFYMTQAIRPLSYTHDGRAALAGLTRIMWLVHQPAVMVLDVIHHHEIVHSLIWVKYIDNFVHAHPLTDATRKVDAVMSAHIGLGVLKASFGRSPVFCISLDELDKRVQEGGLSMGIKVRAHSIRPKVHSHPVPTGLRFGVGIRDEQALPWGYTIGKPVAGEDTSKHGTGHPIRAENLLDPMGPHLPQPFSCSGDGCRVGWNSLPTR